MAGLAMALASGRRAPASAAVLGGGLLIGFSYWTIGRASARSDGLQRFPDGDDLAGHQLRAWHGRWPRSSFATLYWFFWRTL